MIEKVANNKYNTEKLNLNPPEKIKEKLDYYRSLFGKTHDFSDKDFEALKQDVRTFFNLKAGGFTENPPQQLVRISNNNEILRAQNKELSYLTDISQLLAPPVKNCNYGRCNLPNQQVLYCAKNEAGAYWETKPQNGDVITLSYFKLKPGAKVNCNIIKKEKTHDPKISTKVQEVYYLLEEFFVDAYSLVVSKERPRDYLFSALLSSDLLFYPIVSKKNIEAIIFPSVQKKKHGENFAIRNDLIFEKYDLIGVETRFILDEYEDIDPSSNNVTTDQLIGSFGTTEFDFESGKILYKKEEADKLFKLYRELQTGGGKQTRFEQPGLPKNLSLDLSPGFKNNTINTKKQPYGRNDKISVVYQDGTRIDDIKFKKVQEDIEMKKCKIFNY